MASKLDMGKTYDRVEWKYLHGMMTRLSFVESFVHDVMRCVTLESFSMRMNGQLSNPFRPPRGIHQGDPISPYLFLICSKGLSYLLWAIRPMHLSSAGKDPHSMGFTSPI